MAWIFLFAAGLFETAFAVCLKSAAKNPAGYLAVATIILFFASMALLGLAMRELPLGVAYPVWTGIGTVGSVVLSYVLFNQKLDATTILGILGLLIGMILIGGKAHHT